MSEIYDNVSFDDDVSDDKSSSSSREDQSFTKEELQSFYGIDDVFFCPTCHHLMDEIGQLYCGCRGCVTCLDQVEICPNVGCEDVGPSKMLRDVALEKEMKQTKYKCVNNFCEESVSMADLIKYSRMCRKCFYIDTSKIVDKVAPGSSCKETVFYTDNLSDVDRSYESCQKIVNQFFSDRIETIQAQIKKVKSSQLRNQNEIEETEKERVGITNLFETTKVKAEEIKTTMDLNFRTNIITERQACEYVFRISDFEVQRSRANSGCVISPPFYTDHIDYKICLKVYPNGDGTGAGTHLSVYMMLLTGKCDSLLKWPFSKSFTIELLNQKNRKNKSVTFKPDPKSESFKKPTTEPNTGSGDPRFIDFVSLYNGFIKDDTIFIKFRYCQKCCRL